MAGELIPKRIIDLPEALNPADGDALVLDNAETGTKKIPIENLVDKTLTIPKKAADAYETGRMMSIVGIKDIFSGETSAAGLSDEEKIFTLTTDYFNEKFYSTSLNALPVRGASATLSGVTWTPVDNHYELSGEYTTGYFIFDWENIYLNTNIVQPGDTIVFCLKADITLRIWVRYQNGNLITSTAYDPTTNMVKIPVTIPDDFVKMRITVYATDTTYAGTSGKVWFGVYKSTAVFIPCDSYFTSDSTTIDTLYNTMSFEEFRNTKEYVDGVASALGAQITALSDKVDDGVTFLTPEMYGAVGDGNADDTAAFQACINAAIPTKTPIRAEKRYKTTATLSVVGEYQDIKINELKYTGTAHAIEFTCTFSKIEIGRILATATGAVGIVFTDRASGSPDRCQSNYCIIGTLWTNSNCMEFRFVANHYAYYNEFHLRRCYSANANIIYIDNTSPNALAESAFYGAKYLSCAYGYVIYIKDCGTSQARFYEFAFEGDCRNGVYGVTNLINCRTAEMLDRWTEADPRGYLFKVKDELPNGMFAENTRCDYLGIDVSEAITWDELFQKAREGVDNDWTSSDMYYHFGTNFDQFVLDYCNRAGAPGHFANNTHRLMVQGRLKIVYDKIVFIPNKRSTKTIDTALFEAYNTDYTFPTDFIAEADCTIKLNESYCCVGIDSITIEQKNGHKAIIKDKNGNTIFDGSGFADGTYMLICSFVPLGKLTITGINTQKSVTLEAYSTANIYTGSNEKWIIA